SSGLTSEASRTWSTSPLRERSAPRSQGMEREMARRRRGELRTSPASLPTLPTNLHYPRVVPAKRCAARSGSVDVQVVVQGGQLEQAPDGVAGLVDLDPRATL